jgi:hypothetical protein
MPKPETTLPPQEVTPDPVLEKRVRRVFTTDYKLRILRDADSCAHGVNQHGKLTRDPGKSALKSCHPGDPGFDSCLRKSMILKEPTFKKCHYKCYFGAATCSAEKISSCSRVVLLIPVNSLVPTVALCC